MKKELQIGLLAVASPLEIPYLKEWTTWHRSLGVSHIFLCLNDWSEADRVEFDKLFWKESADGWLHVIVIDGKNIQLTAYNQAMLIIKSFDLDWIAVIDLDEFIKVRSDRTLAQILADYECFQSIGINWRMYGNNGHEVVKDKNFSVLTRFTRCGRTLNHHVKQIVHLSKFGGGVPFFINPHCLDKTSHNLEGHEFWGPFNEEALDKTHELELAHFVVKSKEECRIRRSFRRCDTGEVRGEGWENFFNENNINDIDEAELTYEN